MANELDEVTGPVNSAGRDIHVIDKQISVTIGIGSLIFEIVLWVILTIPALIWLFIDDNPSLENLVFIIIGLLPGLLFLFMKINARTYLRQLQQKIQSDAAQIDNFLEQRTIILENAVNLLSKSINLDRDVMTEVAAYRSGRNIGQNIQVNDANLNGIFNRVTMAVESYPELKAHETIANVMAQNSELQKSITAARTSYNYTVTIWNQALFSWPTKQIVAAREGYTTRIPFTVSADTKAAARRVLLDPNELAQSFYSTAVTQYPPH
jgi:LemA protein